MVVMAPPSALAYMRAEKTILFALLSVAGYNRGSLGKGVTVRKLAVFSLLLFLLAHPIYGQQSAGFDDRPKITVNGEAVVYVKPNQIVISFGIETTDRDIRLAKEKNNGILRKAVATARQSGVPEKDIQIDHLSIEPHWKTEYTRRDFLGYFVRNTLVVTLGDTDKVEDLVTKELETGINYIHGVDFHSTEFKKYREEARELALRAAKEKADKMAGTLGQQVGWPLQITESPTGPTWRYSSSWWGWGRGPQHGMTQNVIQDRRAESSEISETLPLGKIAIRSSVTVTFELKR